MFVESILSNSTIVLIEDKDYNKVVRAIKYAAGKQSPNLMIIIDKNIPLSEEIEVLFKNEFNTIVFDDIKPNPDVATVDKITEQLKENKIDIIWVIGGGSFMDSAKAAALLLKNEGSLEDYLGNSPSGTVKEEGIPVIASPTTSGTGAEVTRFGVFTSNSGRKYTFVSEHLQPKVALIIPEFTYSLPPNQTAATSFDALTHALETLWNKNATEITDDLAINAAIDILKTMRTAYQSSLSKSHEGRKEILLAATKAGIAFNLTGTAAIHALSFPLSEKWHIPHGIACAFFFEDVWKINIKNNSVRMKLERIAEGLGLGGNSSDKLFNYVMDIKREMKLPGLFSELNISFSEKEDMPLFMDTLNDPKIKNNLFPFNEDRIRDIVSHKL